MGNRFLEKFLTFIFDTVAISGAFFIAVWLRFVSGVFSEMVRPDLDFTNYYTPAATLTLLWLILYFFTGLYRSWYKESRLDEFFVVARTILFGTFVLLVMVSSDQLLNFAETGKIPNIFSHTRSVTLLTYAGCLLVFSTSIRFILHTVYSLLYRRGIAVQKIAIIGANESALRLIKEIEAHPNLGYRCIGFIDNERIEDFEGYPVLGSYDNISELSRDGGVDGVVISHITNSAKSILNVLNYCLDEHLNIYMVPSLMDVISGHLKTHAIAGVPLIVLLQDHMPQWQADVKRIFDVVVSLVGLTAFAPVWAIVALIVKLTDKGPAIYSQERIGQNAKPFMLHKFRSMYIDAEAKGGPQWATKNDPRITPFGRFMRKTRLDEVPQLLNVLRGEMSLVGPRPERQHFIDILTKEIPWYIKRLKMKPGITGWAQVKHKYDETIEDVKTKIMYDLYYFENMSLTLDLKIIIQTVLVVLTGKGAK
jgi:exopolysaccharide biosynthesis polyprenyl glycosylphosphotransferase